VVVQVKWDKGGNEPADDCTLFYGNGNTSYHLGTGFFTYKGIISAVKKAEFVSDRKSHIILRGNWDNIIVLNVPAPTEDKCDHKKDSVMRN
jgi:hypothetical protein